MRRKSNAWWFPTTRSENLLLLLCVLKQNPTTSSFHVCLEKAQAKHQGNHNNNQESDISNNKLFWLAIKMGKYTVCHSLIKYELIFF